MPQPSRPIRIAVCGAGQPSPVTDALAEEVGRRLAQRGAVLLCGGLGGVMAAAARGARSAGGLTIGFLPGTFAGDANPDIELPLSTGLEEGRNLLCWCGPLTRSSPLAVRLARSAKSLSG